MVFGTSARSTAVVRLCLVFSVYQCASCVFAEPNREMRGATEPSQRTVPPKLSRPGKRDVHNNVLVPSVRTYAY